jgi:tRNA dimethylallyltransferase
MSNKLLVICGPTSTGKTTLAITLAKKYSGEVVSADSRQVYRGMNIGTGKDLPKGARIKFPWFGRYGYYEIEGIKIWGYDLADPRHEFSIAQYLKFAERIVGDIIKRGKLPILAGGTGLYIKGVVDGIPTAEIPRNNSLRKNLEGKAVDELFEMLAQIDSLRAGQMNSSDKKNPRRLIRAIEVATWKIDNFKKGEKMGKKKSDLSVLLIGLNAPEKFLEKKIKLRVAQRIRDGIIEEVRGLLKGRVDWNMQSMSSIGYRQWKDYFEGKMREGEVVKKWEEEERRYAKRQTTWFKKDRRIKWFDSSKPGFTEKVEKSVEKWYKSINVAQS